MSSSPRLIVLLVGAFFFLGAFALRAQAATLTLSPQYHFPGLIFYTPLVFPTTSVTTETLSLEFDQIEAFNLIQPTSPPNPTTQPTPKDEPTAPLPSGLTIEEMIPSPTPTPTDTPTPTPTSTPTPTPIATPTPTLQPFIAPSDLDSLFQRYSDEYHVDKELLKRIAKCESSLNAGASFLDYGGMFQFSTQSWSITRSAMGQDPNPALRYNAEESIKTAAYKISVNGASAWPSCT